MRLNKCISIQLMALILIVIVHVTSCQKNSTEIGSPFDTGTVNTAVDGQTSDVSPDTDWSQDDGIGEKRLYGKISNDVDSSILRYGDMLIAETNYGHILGYFSFEKPNGPQFLCFDPTCLHIPGDETCTAITNDIKIHSPSFPGYVELERDHYPSDMYIDLYESVDGPVIYFCYYRNTAYAISAEESRTREPVYCIERFDITKGKREVVLDNVEDVIEQTCTYGDYVYYVLDKSKEGQELYRISKSGGESQKFDLDQKAESVRMIDVVDDMFYYLVDERYLYRAELDLTASEMVLDISTVKGTNDSNGIINGSYCGYLYYFADYETVWAGEPENSASTVKANLYRIPMNDLAKEPQKVVDGLATEYGYRFTEQTFYYSPCVFKYSTGGETGINECDGKLYAMNMESGESKLIVENSGMTIYPLYAWDDRVLFAGWAYDSTGLKYSGGNSNLVVAYTSGKPFEIYGRKGIFGNVNTD